MWVWGTNFAGGIGDNTVISRSSPVQTISGGTNWCAVSVGNIQSAAIKTDGTLWVWGSNSYGQLGDNTRINRSSPVQTISGGTNWRSINLRCTHVGAVKTDGSLWMWGDQTAGGLGENILIRRSSPVQTISGGTNWYNVSTGFRRTVATKTDGTLWAWGCGYSGNLGNNSTINQSSPVQTISGGTNWKNITIFGSIVGALREGCW